MNIPLIRAWIDVGSPALEDLGPVMGMTDLVLLRYMNGRKYPDKGTQQLLADVFGKNPADLFPQYENDAPTKKHFCEGD